MLQKLLNWVKSLFQKESVYRHTYLADVPDHLKKNVIYIICHNQSPWQIVMVCPCGCSKTLHMNLIQDYSPYWKVSIDNRNRISLHPSVHRTVGCKSHFFIRSGNVDWCGTQPFCCNMACYYGDFPPFPIHFLQPDAIPQKIPVEKGNYKVYLPNQRCNTSI